MQEEKEVGGKNSERTFKSIFKSSYPVKSNDQQHYDSVVIALLPAAGFGIYNFGPRALAVMAVTIASTVLTELLFGWLWKKKITISDMSAVVTGLLLALNLPVSIPLWMAALGGVFAILVVKCCSVVWVRTL